MEASFRNEFAAIRRNAGDWSAEQYLGGDWWQLLPVEIFIFEIDRARWPDMFTAFGSYEVFLEIVEPEDQEFTAASVTAERAAHPDIVARGHSVGGFQAFAKIHGGLTFREAAAVYDKMVWWNVRHGLYLYSDGNEDQS